jgi:hypothetical protein
MPLHGRRNRGKRVIARGPPNRKLSGQNANQSG